METPEKQNKKISPAYIIIALLVLVSLFQTVVLIRQGKRQAVLEKQQRVQTVPLPRSSSNPFATVPPASHKTAAYDPQAFLNNDPFEEFDAMSRRMSNMMRSAFMMSAPMLQNLRQTMAQDLGADFSPAVDLESTTEAYIVRSDLPGLEKDKINLTVRDNVLTIEGMRQTNTEVNDQKNGYFTQERSYGSFARSLTLPGPVDESKVSADYKNGVLTITLPKLGGPKTAQKVPIQ